MQKTIKKKLELKPLSDFKTTPPQPIVWLEHREPYKMQKDKDWGHTTDVPE